VLQLSCVLAGLTSEGSLVCMWWFLYLSLLITHITNQPCLDRSFMMTVIEFEEWPHECLKHPCRLTPLCRNQAILCSCVCPDDVLPPTAG
jgi:hypothetical protein